MTAGDVLRVHLAEGFPADWVEALRARVGDAVAISHGDDPAALASAEVLVAGGVAAETLDAATGVRAIIVPWAGPPPSLCKLLAERDGITLHNLHHNASATAETAFALLIAAAKGTARRDQRFREEGWPARLFDDDSAMLLEGKRAVILGYGEIGRRVGRMCRGFGMEVIGVRRRAGTETDEIGARVMGIDALDEALAASHVLVNAAPGTPETEGLIDERRLRLLREPRVVVNVGRGPTIDETALYDGLKDGWIHAAGLDVWWRYPSQIPEDEKPARPSRFPYHELPNVVTSPHRGGLSMEDDERRMDDLARLLRHAARGEEIPNRVTPRLGY